MINIINSIFGSYTPPTYELVHYTYQGNQYVRYVDTVIPDGISGIDWPWMAGFILFAIALYSLFRMVGALFSGK